MGDVGRCHFWPSPAIRAYWAHPTRPIESPSRAAISAEVVHSVSSSPLPIISSVIHREMRRLINRSIRRPAGLHAKMPADSRLGHHHHHHHRSQQQHPSHQHHPSQSLPYPAPYPPPPPQSAPYHPHHSSSRHPSNGPQQAPPSHLPHPSASSNGTPGPPGHGMPIDGPPGPQGHHPMTNGHSSGPPINGGGPPVLMSAAARAGKEKQDSILGQLATANENTWMLIGELCH